MIYQKDKQTKTIKYPERINDLTITLINANNLDFKHDISIAMKKFKDSKQPTTPGAFFPNNASLVDVDTNSKKIRANKSLLARIKLFGDDFKQWKKSWDAEKETYPKEIKDAVESGFTEFNWESAGTISISKDEITDALKDIGNQDSIIITVKITPMLSQIEVDDETKKTDIEANQLKCHRHQLQ